jgi:hypothetical protein
MEAATVMERIIGITKSSHTGILQRRLSLSPISLPLSAMLNAEEGFPPGPSLTIRFLRGHEALHYGG